MISAKIIEDSVTHHGKRLTTFELEYPRFIHAEVMTHRVMSKSGASSRAITIKAMLSLVWNYMAMPIHWGKNQSGMQAYEELQGWRLTLVKLLWILAGRIICILAYLMYKIGLAKQIVNRMMEPWGHMKLVLSATEFDNFFYLRYHPDAQPELYELARVMYEAYHKNNPRYLKSGEWHLPYIEHEFDPDGNICYYTTTEAGIEDLTLDQAQKISASLCAQVSYRKADMSLKKALKIYQRLVESKPVHASPFEHQATPLNTAEEKSGNFNGWKQWRQEIPGNVCLNYKGPDQK